MLSLDLLYLAKRVGRMASSAIKTKLAVMNIVGSMAVVASATKLSLGIKRLAVAGFTV